jgi:hypothetical protein
MVFAARVGGGPAIGAGTTRIVFWGASAMPIIAAARTLFGTVG